MENTELDLLNVVKDFVVKHNDVQVKNAKNEMVLPNVFKYFTPSAVNQRNQEGVYPAYIVRLGDSVVDSEKQFEDECSIRIVAIATDQDHENGMDQAIKMIRRMKEELQTIGFLGPFDLVGKMKMVVPEEQEFPQWLVYLDMNFNIPGVQSNFI